ncbi:MAG: alkaline phosphatase family protein [Planctomycetota bacterium]
MTNEQSTPKLDSPFSILHSPFLLCLAGLLLTGCQPAAQERFARTVVLISLDGATPAGIAQATTPHLHELLAQGVQSRDARTVYPCKTLPCHTSMLTGVEQAKHGVVQNDFADPLPVPAVPSVFDRLDDAGLDGLMIVGKYKLLTLRSGHYAPLDRVGVVLNRETRHHVPDFIFIHSAEPDVTGDAEGWMSPAYLRALERADEMVGEAVAWVRARGLWDQTLIIVSADHGGHEKSHKGDHPDDLVVPWIASGGAVRCRALPDGLRVTDIAPTVLYALGLPMPDNLDGAPATALFVAPARQGAASISAGRSQRARAVSP